MKKVLVIILFVLNQAAYSQNGEPQLRKLLLRFEANDYVRENHDSLSIELGELLVKVLKHRRINETDSLPSLTIHRSRDKKLSLYCASYWTHGTSLQGYLYALQWVKPDGKFDAVSLDLYLKKNGLGDWTSFWDQIAELPSNEGLKLYLLHGQSVWWYHSERHQFQVIQIENGRLHLNYPAFFDSISLLRYYDDYESYDSTCVDNKFEDEEGRKPHFIEKDQTLRFYCLGDKDELGTMKGAQMVKTFRKRSVKFMWNGRKFIMK